MVEFIDNDLLNRIFTRSSLRVLMDKKTSNLYQEIVRQYFCDSDCKNNRQIIEKIYFCLSRQYRNEYFYKNTLLNRLLLGIYSLRTSTVLTEVPVAKSKADFIFINGHAVVYEIKSELDNYERLAGQVKDYYKAFSYVVVVTGRDDSRSIDKFIPQTTGICIIDKNGHHSMLREPIECTTGLRKKELFKLLRKREYEQILQEQFGKLPLANDFEYYDICEKWFCKMNCVVAQKKVIEILKKRSSVDSTLFKMVPYELKMLVYGMKLKLEDFKKLNEFLYV